VILTCWTAAKTSPAMKPATRPTIRIRENKPAPMPPLVAGEEGVAGVVGGVVDYRYWRETGAEHQEGPEHDHKDAG
jgi:hypothetical protein